MRPTRPRWRRRTGSRHGWPAGPGRPAAPPRRTGSSPRTTGRPRCTSGRRRWSTRTSRSEVTAISSHRNKKAVDAGRGRDQQQGGDEQRQDARRGPAGEAVAVVAEPEDHGADRRPRPRRRRTGRRSGRGRSDSPLSGSSWFGVHHGGSAGVQARRPPPRSRKRTTAMVRADDDRGPDPLLVQAPPPPKRPGQPVRWRRAGRRSRTGQAPQRGDDRCGVRRATGNLEVDRHHVRHRALDAVGALEHAAIAGTIAHSNDDAGSGDRLEASCAKVRPCCG